MQKKFSGVAFISYAVFILVSLVCLIPYIIIMSISLSDGTQILQSGYSVLPKGLTFKAYQYIFKSGSQLLTSYKVTTIVTVIGTALSLFISAMIAYVLSRKEYKYRNLLSFLLFLTMLFSGGMIPTYILVTKYLGLTNTLWALILPALVSPWNVMLLRTFFSDLPEELNEAAYIDGANEFLVFFKIVLPMSVPALATIGTLIGIAYWSDWFSGLLYITKDGLVPLQYLLYRITNNLQQLQEQLDYFGSNMEVFPQEPVRMAMVVIATGPMLFVFLFTQKYFIKGLTIGAVKG